MNLVRAVGLAVVFAALFASDARATDGTIIWNTGQPATGPFSGTITVGGTFTLSSGCSLVPNGCSAQYWVVGSGPVSSQILTVNGSTFSGTLTGLTSGQSYNIVVQIDEQNVMTSATDTLASDPKTASAR